MVDLIGGQRRGCDAAGALELYTATSLLEHVDRAYSSSLRSIHLDYQILG